jgi:hypothetical protein
MSHISKKECTLPEYILKPEKKFIPIRLGCFSNAFWNQWEKLSQMEQDSYVLGWLAKIEKLVDSLEEQVAKLLEELANERDPN